MPFIVRKRVRLTQAWAGIHREVEGAVADALAEEVKELVPVYTGEGRESVKREGRFIKAEAHVAYLDQGVAPGRAFPPSDVMERWGQKVLGKSGLGFVLARSIYRKGIRPRKFVQRAWRVVMSKRRRGLERRADEGDASWLQLMRFWTGWRRCCCRSTAWVTW